MRDLFTLDRQFEPIAMPNADVSILHHVVLPHEAEHILRRLISDTPWRQDEIVLFGKPMLQPRLHAWYGDAGAAYTYSGLRNEPLPWTPLLAEIKSRVKAALRGSAISAPDGGAHFNSVLLNLYRDHNDSMGFHSDDERELGKNPVIASLTFGATRTFLLKHKFRKELPPVKVPLEAGTVLLMKGKTQQNWKHGINKQTQPCGPRVNLTFRTIYN